MLMKYVKQIAVVLAAAVVMCGSSVYAAKGDGSVLVVPSRYTVIQLAFDIAALRDVTLVSYENSDADKDPVLYRWDAFSSAWKVLTADEYAVGSFSAATPTEMILVGSGSDLPATLIAGASQAKKVSRIESLNIVDMVNSLNKSMKFTPREWQILSERHGFTYKDKNEERRRWGRYGPPGERKAAKKAAAVQEEDCDVVVPVCVTGEEEKTPFEILETELDSMSPADATKGLELEPEDAPIPEADVPVVQKSAEADVPVMLLTSESEKCVAEAAVAEAADSEAVVVEEPEEDIEPEDK